jgi:hypothetical protein
LHEAYQYSTQSLGIFFALLAGKATEKYVVPQLSTDNETNGQHTAFMAWGKMAY